MAHILWATCWMIKHPMKKDSISAHRSFRSKERQQTIICKCDGTMMGQETYSENI